MISPNKKLSVNVSVPTPSTTRIKIMN